MKPAKLNLLKAVVTLTAVTALVVRTIFPDLQIDAVALGLLILALLPWLSPLIKSAELPGGVKIEFQDVKEAAEKITRHAITVGGVTIELPEPGLLAIADQDPNLALVGLRIEIDKRIRALAEAHGVSTRLPLPRLTTQLAELGILDREIASGLRDLVALGNQAAHGTPVSRDAALSAVDYGPQVLAALDAKLVRR